MNIYFQLLELSNSEEIKVTEDFSFVMAIDFKLNYKIRKFYRFLIYIRNDK